MYHYTPIVPIVPIVPQPIVSGYALTPYEQQQIAAAFSQAAGIDGKIDSQEFLHVIVRMNPSLRNHPNLGLISATLFTQVDTNNSGYINIHEFMTAFPALRAQLGFWNSF